MGMTIFSFLFLNIEISIGKKIILISSISIGLVLIQNIKGTYRDLVNTNLQGNATQFGNLLLEETKQGGNLFTTDKLFIIYVRTNQGFNVANVMKYIPSNRQFDNGSYLGLSFLSALVPRLIWPDKPKVEDGPL